MVPSVIVTTAWFDDVYLEDEQRQVLAWMVEAERSLPQANHGSFLLADTAGGCFLVHTLVAERPPVRKGDVDALADHRLLRRSRGNSGNSLYDVTPQGRRYYAEMKRRGGEAALVVHKEIRSFLDGKAFMHSFPDAYDRWHQAEQGLWDADNPAEMTRIGHTCREALQEFAAALAKRHGVEASADHTKTVQRIRAVLDKQQAGKTHQAFLDALLAYWGTVSDLAQRQEHGGLREQDPLTWEDTRRVVFQTAIVMFEIAQAAD
jgi:hypothetical protein